jgi:predicted secreted protein
MWLALLLLLLPFHLWAAHQQQQQGQVAIGPVSSAPDGCLCLVLQPQQQHLLRMTLRLWGSTPW